MPIDFKKIRCPVFNLLLFVLEWVVNFSAVANFKLSVKHPLKKLFSKDELMFLQRRLPLKKHS